MSTLWSRDEEQILRSHYDEHDYRWEGWEALLPGRSPRAIKAKAYSLHLVDVPVKDKTVPVETKMEPIDGFVLTCFRAGLTASQIDKFKGWRPGKAKLILTEIWRRMKDAGEI